MVKLKSILKGFPSRPYIASWFSIKNHPSKPVLFLIDTGSELSFLSPIDAVSMGIILDELPPPHKQLVTTIGVIPNESLGLIKEYTMKFASDRGWFEVFGENILVFKKDFGFKLPSILGVDFLVKYNFKVDFNPSENSIIISNEK